MTLSGECLDRGDLALLVGALLDATNTATVQIEGGLRGGGDTRMLIAHPVSLHDQISRCLSKGQIEMPKDELRELDETLVVVGEELTKLWQVVKKFERRVKAQTRRELALAVDVSMSPIYGVVEASELRDMQLVCASEDLRKLRGGLLQLKSIAEQLLIDTTAAQAEIDMIEDASGGAADRLREGTEALRSAFRNRLRWIPIGSALGGMGFGALVGLTGGPLGAAVGAAVGCAGGSVAAAAVVGSIIDG